MIALIRWMFGWGEVIPPEVLGTPIHITVPLLDLTLISPELENTIFPPPIPGIYITVTDQLL